MADHAPLSPSPPPRQLSSFVGRVAEIEELRQLVGRARLVTLTGPGGCGKTRLAIELAAVIGAGFPDGVAYADLTPLREPAAVAGSVASAFGLVQGDTGRLAGLIGDACPLLVIDNAEHLVEAVSSLAVGLLGSCPNLHVVITSRELLDVAGEVSWRVPPLGLPPVSPPGAPLNIGCLADSDAVELLVTRLTEHRPGFRLTEENAGLVSAICHRLDGLPLALELAAARIRSMALTEIVERLDDSFQLLTRGSRNATARHRTLRATIEWSHELLDEAERRLLRLAVFVGSVELDAVEAVCASAELPAAEVPDALHRLVDKSLVTTHPQADGGMRYSLLEVIRQFGRRRLLEAGESGYASRHARHYADLLLRLDTNGADVGARVARLRAEYDNVRVAMDWASAHDAALEARMVSSARWFWMRTGSIREAAARSLAVIERGLVDAARRLDLYVDASGWSMQAGDFETALGQIEEAASLLDQVDDLEREARVLVQRGALVSTMGRVESAECDLSRAITILEGLPPSRQTAGALNNLACLRLQSGRAVEALEDVERALTVVADPPRPAWFPNLLQTRGAILLALDRGTEARDTFLRGLELAAESDNQSAAIALLHGLACGAAAAGRASTCLELLGAAQRCERTVGLSARLPNGTPSEEAERASRQALGERAAAEAWARGLQMDLRAAMERARQDQPAERPPVLPPRKAELVRLVAAGLANKEIARRMSISERTVETHLDQLRQQLGFQNRTQIATWAVSTGLAPAD
jgi:non-specific serine/threonine protein kinase